MRITTLVLVMACVAAVCVARPAEEYEYEDEPAPAPAPAPKPAAGGRHNPLLRRNPLNSRAAAKSTTTTPPPPPKEEEEVEEDGELTDEEFSEVTTTTEAPKKKLRSGIVRPFRSNDDLLATLKRRREQASIGKTHAAKSHDNHDESAPAEAATPAPKRATTSGRRRFNAAPKAEEPQDSAEATPAPSRSGRRFSARS